MPHLWPSLRPRPRPKSAQRALIFDLLSGCLSVCLVVLFQVFQQPAPTWLTLMVRSPDSGSGPGWPTGECVIRAENYAVCVADGWWQIETWSEADNDNGILVLWKRSGYGPRDQQTDSQTDSQTERQRYSQAALPTHWPNSTADVQQIHRTNTHWQITHTVAGEMRH